MELRTTEEKINELLAAYEGIRGSSILQPEQDDLLPPTPIELAVTTKAKAISICDKDAFVRSLRSTEIGLVEVRPKMEKFRKRLFEIDPVTEKPRYGPKSQARVRLLVARNDFLCAQYDLDFAEQYQNQRLLIEQYKQQQVELQDQRQEKRRQEFLIQEELRKKEEEQGNDEEAESSAEETTRVMTIDANMNPDGSIIIAQNADLSEKNDAMLALSITNSSPSSLLFAELQQQHELQQQEKRREEDSKEKAMLQEEEEKRRKIAEEEAKQKALQAQIAAEKAAEEAARTHAFHQQAEEVRLRRRAQEEAQKDAEREWLEGIQKGPEGVKHYLEILLERPQEQGKDIGPDRLVALQSLCTLYEQIQKHPEEVNKRKIKVTNPNFHRDIGRHSGGIELLVAAGFRPTMLPATIDNENGGESKENNDEDEQPDIAFLISKEPNLEHDMDGWMAWFDLNKATLEILQTELQNVQGSKRSRK